MPAGDELPISRAYQPQADHHVSDIAPDRYKEMLRTDQLQDYDRLHAQQGTIDHDDASNTSGECSEPRPRQMCLRKRKASQFACKSDSCSDQDTSGMAEITVINLTSDSDDALAAESSA